MLVEGVEFESVLIYVLSIHCVVAILAHHVPSGHFLRVLYIIPLVFITNVVFALFGHEERLLLQ